MVATLCEVGTTRANSALKAAGVASAMGTLPKTPLSSAQPSPTPHPTTGLAAQGSRLLPTPGMPSANRSCPVSGGFSRAARSQLLVDTRVRKSSLGLKRRLRGGGRGTTLWHHLHCRTSWEIGLWPNSSENHTFVQHLPLLYPCFPPLSLVSPAYSPAIKHFP